MLNRVAITIQTPTGNQSWHAPIESQKGPYRVSGTNPVHFESFLVSRKLWSRQNLSFPRAGRPQYESENSPHSLENILLPGKLRASKKTTSQPEPFQIIRVYSEYLNCSLLLVYKTFQGYTTLQYHLALGNGGSLCYVLISLQICFYDKVASRDRQTAIRENEKWGGAAILRGQIFYCNASRREAEAAQ